MPITKELATVCEAVEREEFRNSSPEEARFIANYWHAKFCNLQADYNRQEFLRYFQQENLLARQVSYHIDEVLIARAKAKASKNYELADTLKDLLSSFNVDIADGKRETIWSWRHGRLHGIVKND